jgi:hypothetical protein
MPLGMRRLALIALVATLLPACTTRQKIAGAGAGLAIVGLGLSFSNEERTDDEAMDTTGKIGIACLLGGLAVLFVAAALEESDTDDSPKTKEIKVAAKPPEVAPTGLAAAQKRRDQAKLLTKEAHAAAAAGDCAKVQELSAQVGAIDRLYYGEIFMKDDAVQKCFQPVEPPAEAPAVPPATVTPTLTPTP